MDESQEQYADWEKEFLHKSVEYNTTYKMIQTGKTK